MQASFQDFDRLVASATVVYDSPANGGDCREGSTP